MSDILDEAKRIQEGYGLLEDVELEVVDRSTLERWATCPAQASLLTHRNINDASLLAESGEQVHQAFGKVIHEHVESQGVMGVRELQQLAESYVAKSRPDVQPDAVQGSRYSTWGLARFLYELHPQNVLAFDGGEGKKSGQFSRDIGWLNLRVTSEIDLLHAGPSKKVLHEKDWKTGWKFHTAEDVKTSFQFQLHAWLIWENYPDVDALEVQVWNTRTNRFAWPVEFTKEKDAYNIERRIHNAAEIYSENKDKPPEEAEAWPAAEKCRICSAAQWCPVSGDEAMEIQSDPGKFVDRMVAVEAQLEAMKAAAKDVVDYLGRDLVGSDGTAFGRDKPPSNRKPAATFYKVEDTDGS